MSGSSVALDTNQAIAVLNGQPGMEKALSRYSSVCLPFPVVGELLYGAMHSQHDVANIERVRAIVSKCALLEGKQMTAEVHAQIRLGLRRRGRPIPENDVLIAALCIEHGMPLATSDAHFAEIEGLLTLTLIP